MRTRIFTMLVALLCLPLVGWGQSDVWDKKVSTEWYSADGGTESNPYLIKTAADLAGLAKIVNEGVEDINEGNPYDFSGKYFRLENDIILNENAENYESWGDNPPTNEWIPIGRYYSYKKYFFEGIFEGGNHTISGIYINQGGTGQDKMYKGLFGGIGYRDSNAKISNLCVDKSYIKGQSHVGGIVGQAIYATIENCSNKGTIIGTNIDVGGICGSGYYTTIENCYNVGHIIGEVNGNAANKGGIGGIGGGDNTYEVIVKNCYNLGIVEGKGSAAGYVGGIWGELGNTGKIYNCYNEGSIKSECDFTGGIVGNACSWKIEIKQCYNVGNVTGTDYVGGITGWNSYRNSSGNSTHISHCYNTGTISGNNYIGGISGGNNNYPHQAENCFNVGLIKGEGTNVGGILGTFGNSKNSVTNCYYLEGTAEKGIGDDKATAEIKTASELAALITSTLFTTENGWSGDDASYTTTDAYTHTLKLPTFTTGNYVEVPIYEVHLENAGEAITSSLKQGTVKDGICTFTKNNDEEITITQQPANSPFTEWESGVAFSMPANDLVVSVKEKEYTITIQEPYDEQISSSHEKATEGTTITLSPIEEGKEIKDFVISYEKDGAITEGTIQGNTFEMPASDVEIISVTFVEPEQPSDDDEDQGNTGIHKPQRPIKYYNIYVDTICPGLNVEVSKDVVQEGHQVSAYLTIQAECDTTGMRFEYKRGLFGYWKDLKELEGVQPGEYIIKNIYTDIYIRALDATLPEEEPTGIEDLEGIKAYAKDGSIYVYTPNREEVTIISMSGAIIKHAEQVGLQSYSVNRGIYIVRIGEKVFKLKN